MPQENNSGAFFALNIFFLNGFAGGTQEKKMNSVFCRQLFDSFERVKYHEKNHEIDFEGLGMATRILFFLPGGVSRFI